MGSQLNQAQHSAQPTVKSVPNAKQPGSSQSVMQSFAPAKQGVPLGMVIVVLIIMIALGVGVGYSASLFSVQAGTGIVSRLTTTTNKNLVKGKIYGNGSSSVFKDTAEGVMQKGGIDGEGAYHLVRPGGASQDVYLTSSVVDLSQFIGSKVKVWGETQKAQHAGWLMDVGKVQVE